MMKKILCLFLCTLLLTGAAFANVGPSIAAPAGLLMHQSGKVLYEKDAHTKREPASVTKIMTLLLVIEAIENGQIALTDTITASAYATSMGGSQVWLKEGEQMSVEEMVKCVAIASANDCSVALAEHIAGTEEAFVALMNQRAEQLGMTNTYFANCSGLPAQGHETTPYDIALMSAELIRHDLIKDYTTIQHDSIRNGAFVLDNTNKLLKTMEGVTGLKTGSTNNAGFCISVTALRDGLSLIAVVMKGDTSPSRNADATALLNYGFANYASVNLLSDKPIMPIPVQLGREEQVTCVLQSAEPLVLEKNRLKAVEKEIILLDNLIAPVEMGQEVGQMVVSAQGEEIAVIPIIAEYPVERMNVWEVFCQVLKYATMRA